MTSLVDNFNITIAKLNDANETIIKLDNKITKTEQDLNKKKNEINNIKRSLNIEKKNERRY